MSSPRSIASDVVGIINPEMPALDNYLLMEAVSFLFFLSLQTRFFLLLFSHTTVHTYSEPVYVDANVCWLGVAGVNNTHTR